MDLILNNQSIHMNTFLAFVGIVLLTGLFALMLNNRRSIKALKLVRSMNDSDNRTALAIATKSVEEAKYMQLALKEVRTATYFEYKQLEVIQGLIKFVEDSKTSVSVPTEPTYGFFWDRDTMTARSTSVDRNDTASDKKMSDIIAGFEIGNLRKQSENAIAILSTLGRQNPTTCGDPDCKSCYYGMRDKR